MSCGRRRGRSERTVATSSSSSPPGPTSPAMSPSSSSTTAPARSAGPARSPSTRPSTRSRAATGRTCTPPMPTSCTSGTPTAGGSTGRRRSPNRATSRSTARSSSYAPVLQPETIVAVERDTGEIRWERPSVGGRCAGVDRRPRAPGLHRCVHAASAQRHHRQPHRTGRRRSRSSPPRTRASSSPAATVVTSYGMNDLGTAWQLDVGEVPDELAVASGYLVARSGAVLRGYG